MLKIGALFGFEPVVVLNRRLRHGRNNKHILSSPERTWQRQTFKAQIILNTVFHSSFLGIVIDGGAADIHQGLLHHGPRLPAGPVGVVLQTEDFLRCAAAPAPGLALLL